MNDVGVSSADYYQNPATNQILQRGHFRTVPAARARAGIYDCVNVTRGMERNDLGRRFQVVFLRANAPRMTTASQRQDSTSSPTACAGGSRILSED